MFTADRVDRAVSPAVGTVLLVAIVVVAVAVGTVVPDVERSPGTSRVMIDGTADAGENVVTLVHRGGDTLPVAELDVRVEIEGQPLSRQPPVPFFSAEGFSPGPTGPFNPSADGNWEPGESASFQLARTNSPTLSPGDQVIVRITVDEALVETVRTVA